MIVILVALALVIIIGFVILKLSVSKNDNRHTNPSRPKSPASKKVIENDKIIVIQGADYEDIKKVLYQFCNIYNKDDYAAIIKLTQISKSESILTFPYDIDFSVYCFLINYLYYPDEISYKANIKGWATTKSADDFISKKNADQLVMLYIPAGEKEFDNVYMTTENHKGYKLGFAIGGIKTLDFPKENFVRNKYEIKDIADKQSEEIE